MNCSPPHSGRKDESRFWTVDEVARLAAGESESADTADTNPSPPVVDRQAISGTYRGSSATEQLDLRVDLDGDRPLRQVSGDLYTISGGTVTYFGSFVVHSPTVHVTAGVVTASGVANFSFSTSTPVVTVKIPRVVPGTPLAAASVTLSSAAGAAGTMFSCAFVMRAFRVVQWEQDSIQGTTPFDAYDVALLPSGGRARKLSVPAAYAEAGIEIQIAGASNVFTSPVAGATWNDAELHAAMVEHFSLLADSLQWRVWLLVATAHDTPTMRGVMFDQLGRHRQGCAVFDKVVGGSTNEQKRGALRTYVHELGHCFNLVHSWEKSRTLPPHADRLSALSYMNSPEAYPGGPAAFWTAFPFQFDEPELRHLRHGFRDNVIMGGADIKTGAADIDELMVSRPDVDNSGLELRLEGAWPARGRRDLAYRYSFGEPVIVELRLAAFDTRGKAVHEHLHPNYGYVQVIVRQPSGALKLFRPLADRCVATSIITVTPDAPLYTSAYIGYGKDGFTFQQPGFYDIRAIYQAPDGSDVVSNILRVRISNPRSKQDEDLVDLYSGDDQGKLFTFIGSDAPSLASGNRALDVVIERYGKHPLAAYAELVKGMSAKRAFKYIAPEKVVAQRNARLEDAASFLQAAASRQVLDNVTMNKTMREIAKTQAKLGDVESALNTLGSMVCYFEGQKLRPSVLNTIRTQAAEAASSFKQTTLT